MRYIVELFADKDELKRVTVTEEQANEIRRLQEDDMSGVVILNSTSVNIKAIKDIYPDKTYFDEKRNYAMNKKRSDMWTEFISSENLYIKQKAVEKAKREYYTRFMGLMLSVYGLKRVMGEGYVSPSTTDNDWVFTDAQKQARRNRFDQFIETLDRAEYFKKDLKRFFVDYFEKNPKRTWCPMRLWLESIGLPTSRFERIALRHDAQVEKVYERR